MKRSNASIFSMPTKNMRFDIPLHARVGTEFLALLMALMTFLCILAGCISLSLNTMASTWTNGLADTITIEIPASKSNDINDELIKKLSAIQGVKEAHALNKDELEELVEPWLGKGTNALEDLPVPSLINIKLNERTPEIIKKISDIVTQSSPDAKVDAHDNWLNDILKLSKALQLAGSALIIIISIVTALTVSGAVKSRMAIHHTELELLHIMGASDQYITRQFQKYILVLSGKGVLIGALSAIIFLLATHFLAANMPDTLPKLDLRFTQALILPAISLFLILISVFAAYKTAMSVLKEMP